MALMRRAGRTRAVVATAALAGTLLLGACGQADTAAVVNGERISESDLREAVEQINAASPNSQIDAGAAVGLLVLSRFALPEAEKAGKTITDSQIAAAFPNNPLGPVARDVVRANEALNTQNPTQFSLDADQAAVVVEQAQQAKISLNPRYGRFDSSSVAVVAASPNWIAEGSADEAPEPDATPGG